MERSIVTKITLLLTAFGITSCSSFDSPTVPTQTPERAAPVLIAETTKTIWEGSNQAIWQALLRTPTSKLITLQESTQNIDKSAWIELALIAKHKANPSRLANELLDWRERYPAHPANQLLPTNEGLNQLNDMQRPKQIAILLPQSGRYSELGKAVKEGYLNAYYTNLVQGQKQGIKFYDTAGTLDMSALYQQAVSAGADFVIGPLIKENVKQLSESTQLTIPTLALNYVNSRPVANHFYQFGLRPEDETGQMAKHAYEAGYRQALMIAPDNQSGKRLLAGLSSAWISAGGKIADTWLSLPNTDFAKKMAAFKQPIDVIFLFSTASEATHIAALFRNNASAPIPIYTNASISTLKNITVCDLPFNLQKREPSPLNRFKAVGQDAYLISQSFSRLTLLPHFPIYGSTGALTLSPQHQIERRLPCKKVNDAIV